VRSTGVKQLVPKSFMDQLDTFVQIKLPDLLGTRRKHSGTEAAEGHITTKLVGQFILAGLLKEM